MTNLKKEENLSACMFSFRRYIRKRSHQLDYSSTSSASLRFRHTATSSSLIFWEMNFRIFSKKYKFPFILILFLEFTITTQVILFKYTDYAIVITIVSRCANTRYFSVTQTQKLIQLCMDRYSRYNVFTIFHVNDQFQFFFHPLG